MIPDDAVIAVYVDEMRIRGADKICAVVVSALSGYAGALGPEDAAHLHATDNPHLDGLENLCVPDNGGGWFKLGEGGIVLTDAEPLYPEDIRWPVGYDAKVKTDAGGGEVNLVHAAAFPFVVSGHCVRIHGDESVGRRVFYGTDAAGTLGFCGLPGEQVVP